MALGSLIEAPPEQEPEKQEDLLAKEREERQKLEAQLKEQDAVNRARVEQLEHEMGRKFAQSRQEGPPANEYYQAQQELNLTDEQILANPSENIAKLVEHISGKHIAASNQQMSQVLGEQVQWRVNQEFEALKDHPYYKHLKGLLREHFEDRPQEQIQAGRIREKFDELIGQHYEELKKREVVPEDTNVSPSAERSRTRAVEPSISPPSPAGKPKEEKEFVLDPDPEMAAAIRETMKNFPEANLSEEEWVGIEEGKLLPKKRTVAIQMGRGKPNVNY